jgi:O-antigen ligase
MKLYFSDKIVFFKKLRDLTFLSLPALLLIKHSTYSKLLIVYCTLAIATHVVSKRKIKITNEKLIYLLLFCGFYLLPLIGFFRTEDKSEGLKYLLLYLPFIIIPPVVILFQDISKTILFRFFASFIVCTFLSIIISWIYIINKLLVTDGSLRRFFNWGFSYGNLTEAISIGGIYLAIVINISFLMIYLLYKNYRLSQRNKILLFSALIIITIFLFHLASRGGILIFLLLLGTIITLEIIQTKSLKLIIPASIIFLISIFSVIYMPYLNMRILDNSSTEETRITRWKAITKIIRQHPLYGVGLADASSYLINAYNAHNQEIAYKREYNTHNMYLQIAVSGGIPWLFYYVVMLMAPVYRALKYKQYLFMAIILIFTFSSMTESIFHRSKGVILFLLTYIPFLSFNGVIISKGKIKW